ncbi:hypothetical protein MNV49_002782 [Pseudohyphozyma bogoriensis]|nr:hypothetical protein MNV49_002782 [Pseudohyphozyma bogoriensis]
MTAPAFPELILDRLHERDRREKSNATLVAAYRDLAKQTILLKERNTALLAASNVKGGATPSSGADNAVRAAFLSSVEAQLADTKLELAEQYKIQSSNAQRLLVLTDNLREAEERGREERDELRKLRSEVEGLRERARWHKELVAEKEKQLLNENLKIDNSSLLTRWLESKQEEASRMNEALMNGLESVKKPKPPLAEAEASSSGDQDKDKAP